MKLLSVAGTRSAWFLHLDDLNPRGRAVERNALLEILRRYTFGKAPTVAEIVEARQKGAAIIFADGVFKPAPDRQEISVQMSVYRDAIFADTRSSTADGDAFLEDMLGWLHSDIGLIDYRTLPIRKIYINEVNIRLSKSLNHFNAKFEAFSKYLADAIVGPTKNLSVEVGSLAFWIDPSLKHAHTPFRLERREGSAFEENRYYSIAPLETEAHLAALEQLEKMMA